MLVCPILPSYQEGLSISWFFSFFLSFFFFFWPWVLSPPGASSSPKLSSQIMLKYNLFSGSFHKTSEVSSDWPCLGQMPISETVVMGLECFDCSDQNLTYSTEVHTRQSSPKPLFLEVREHRSIRKLRHIY